MISFRVKPAHRRWGLILCLLAGTVGCEDSCTKPCGVFELHDNGVTDTATVNRWSMDLDFDFNPAACGEDCTCNLVCFVQIVRNVDNEDGTYLYPSSEKADRATAQGFYIDRLAGRIWGYYGRNDDGSFAGTMTVGSDSTVANLIDAPSRPEAEPWIDFLWMAVTVPVCIDNKGSSCNNHLLGYYEWGWWVWDDGAVDTFHWTAPKGFKDDVDEAVDEWNVQAPGLGKNTFPAFTRLSE